MYFSWCFDDLASHVQAPGLLMSKFLFDLPMMNSIIIAAGFDVATLRLKSFSSVARRGVGFELIFFQ